MNERQKKFVDHYIGNGGNATAAAISAGYKAKNARVVGAQNLTKVDILDAITERNSQLEAGRIADLSECLTILTKTARGELASERVIGGLPVKVYPNFTERLKACEIRLRTLGAFLETETRNSITVNFAERAGEFASELKKIREAGE